MEKIAMKEVILEKVAIMIELLITILNCGYSDAFAIITNSETYEYMKNGDYTTLHDSPQANLSEIGLALRKVNNPIGFQITDEKILQAMINLRQQNSKTN